MFVGTKTPGKSPNMLSAKLDSYYSYGSRYHENLDISPLRYGLVIFSSPCSAFFLPFFEQADFKVVMADIMSVKPTVALRAILVGGIAAFAKIGGAMKAAGGVKLGAAAAAVSAAATAAVSGSKQEVKDSPEQSPK
ncbi:hypothetical protein SASPL_123233 [Salvia splendens]|uniref:Uncharacterized protein n=1 Tax=Salvia splendens TaxID=180675 RepID=A0A8X8ZTS2_SALSN|nr:hypothetical protein SASPL_123233 [Salvia splendens]